MPARSGDAPEDSRAFDANPNQRNRPHASETRRDDRLAHSVERHGNVRGNGVGAVRERRGEGPAGPHRGGREREVPSARPGRCCRGAYTGPEDARLCDVRRILGLVLTKRG